MKLVNIVATVDLKQQFDLTWIHQHIKKTILSPNSRWLKMRIQPHNSYIAFYKSGKFLVHGKTLKNIEETTDNVLNILKNIGINTDNYNIKIHNVVALDSIEMGKTIENLILSLDPEKYSYETEQFPALVYKDWGVSFLLFNNGKIILTGAKDVDQVKVGLEKFRNLILQS